MDEQGHITIKDVGNAAGLSRLDLNEEEKIRFRGQVISRSEDGDSAS